MMVMTMDKYQCDLYQYLRNPESCHLKYDFMDKIKIGKQIFEIDGFLKKFGMYHNDIKP